MRYLQRLGIFIVTICFIVLFTVYLPVTIKADSNCKKQGYHKAEVTLTLDVYCIKYADKTLID